MKHFLIFSLLFLFSITTFAQNFDSNEFNQEQRQSERFVQSSNKQVAKTSTLDFNLFISSNGLNMDIELLSSKICNFLNVCFQNKTNKLTKALSSEIKIPINMSVLSIPVKFNIKIVN